MIKLLMRRIIEVQKKMIEVITKLLQLKKEKNYYAFQEALGKRESGGNYQVVNSFGYLGKYQFGMARLCDLGYARRKPGATGFSNSTFEWERGYSRKIFLNNPSFQDKIFREHVIDLAKAIKKSSFFSGYLGKHVDGITITLSGLVAGAHLGGLGGIAKTIFGVDVSDAYNTSVSEYVCLFKGYNLEITN